MGIGMPPPILPAPSSNGSNAGIEPMAMAALLSSALTSLATRWLRQPRLKALDLVLHLLGGHVATFSRMEAMRFACWRAVAKFAG